MCDFFIHPRHSSELPPPLRSDQFVVCFLLDFSFLLLFFLKKRRFGKAQAKTKGWERKVPVILCCEILYQFLADCDRSKRAKGKAAWFFVCVDLWTVLNVVASKSQVVFNRSCCHGNHENVTFDLSVKLFHQYIFYLPSFSLWAATFLLPWFGKWHILTNCQNCVQPP